MNTLAGSLGMAFSRSELLGVALIWLEVTRCLGRSAGKDRGDRWALLEDLGYGLRLQRSGFEGRQSGGVFLASGPPLSISQWPNSTGAQDSPGKACLSITPYSNFGGSAIRYDKVPGALGMLESTDNLLPIEIVLRIEWAEPRAWRCSGSRSTWQISPGGGCAKTDGSCWSKSERGRGAGAALAKKSRTRYCLASGEGATADSRHDRIHSADPQISPRSSASIANCCTKLALTSSSSRWWHPLSLDTIPQVRSARATWLSTGRCHLGTWRPVSSNGPLFRRDDSPWRRAAR